MVYDLPAGGRRLVQGVVETNETDAVERSRDGDVRPTIRYLAGRLRYPCATPKGNRGVACGVPSIRAPYGSGHERENFGGVDIW
jgi:hypothetical protein